MNQYPSQSRKVARWYERFAWYCCKVDFVHMEQSPHSDRVMYQGLGWSIIASSCIASISSGYGLMMLTDIPGAALLGAVIGICMVWLCRYSISRINIGDGTARITMKELFFALPPLITILVLGSILSLPMEYIVLRSEVDVAIYSQQAQQKALIREEVHATFFQEQQDIRRAITKLEATITIQENKHALLLYQLSEMKERVNNTPKDLRTHKSISNPSWSDQVKIVERLEDQVSLSKIQTTKVIQRTERKLETELAKEQALIVKIRSVTSSKIDQLPKQYGFIDSLPYLKQVGGHVRLFIKGLICSILLSPFIFMLMLSKNTYWIFKIQPSSNEPEITGDFL